MITDLIINILVTPVYGLFTLFSLPVVKNIALPDNVFEALLNCLYNAEYVFPLRFLLFMFTTFFAIDNFKTIWALILRIKSFIPSMGH